MSRDKHKSNNVNFGETKIKTGQIWPDWYQTLRIFRASNSLKATWQLINTIIPYFSLWYLTIRSVQLGYPYILTLLLVLTAAAFLVRMFVLFHDCVHCSLLNRRTPTHFSATSSVCFFLHHLKFGVSRTSGTMEHTLISIHVVLEIYGL